MFSHIEVGRNTWIVYSFTKENDMVKFLNDNKPYYSEVKYNTVRVLIHTNK